MYINFDFKYSIRINLSPENSFKNKGSNLESNSEGSSDSIEINNDDQQDKNGGMADLYEKLESISDESYENEKIGLADTSRDDLNLSKAERQARKSPHERKASLRHTFADFRQDPNKLKTKSVLYIILSILGVVYAVTCFWTSVNAYRSIGKNPLALSGLIHNWRATPITDIRTQDGRCTSGYEEMIVRRWPGTKAGCYCEGKVTVSDGSCPNGCEEIHAQGPVTINRFFGKTICVKRSGTDIMNAVR